MKKFAKTIIYAKVWKYLFHNFFFMKIQWIKGKRNVLKHFLGKTSGFTLVELIIVITILAILATIAFISFQWFISQSKDANKLSTLKNIDSWLNLYALKTGKFPLLQQFDIYGTWIIDNISLHTYWKISEHLWNIIHLNGKITDPNNDFYLYWVSFDQKNYQLATFLENQEYANNIIPNTYAKENKTIHILWNYDWLLIYNSGANTKYIVNLPSLIFSQTGTIDIVQNDPYFLYNWKKIWITKDTLLEEITKKTVSLTWVLLTHHQNQVNELSNILWYEKQKIWEKIFWKNYKNTFSTKKLWIYYWWPSDINNEKNDWQLNLAIQDFNEYDSIILWADLENPDHLDYQNTKDILNGTGAGVHWYAPQWFSWYRWTAYWYITLMNDINSIKTSIDKWKEVWIKGIFFDEAWYDFLIDNYSFITKSSVRTHQNEAIDYAHSLGLKVMMNSWVIDDVFWTSNGEAPTTLRTWDSYLLENFVYNHTISSPHYDYDNQLQKIQKALDYKANVWIDLHCVWLLPNSSLITSERIETFYEKSLWICDYIQITEENFWASQDNSPLVNYLKDYK